MFGLFITKKGLVLQRRYGISPNEKRGQGKWKVFKYRLAILCPDKIATAMVNRGNSVLDGGYTTNHSETDWEIKKRVEKNRLSKR